jgi:hypothetical protein
VGALRRALVIPPLVGALVVPTLLPVAGSKPVAVPAVVKSGCRRGGRRGKQDTGGSERKKAGFHDKEWLAGKSKQRVCPSKDKPCATTGG